MALGSDHETSTWGVVEEVVAILRDLLSAGRSCACALFSDFRDLASGLGKRVREEEWKHVEDALRTTQRNAGGGSFFQKYDELLVLACTELETLGVLTKYLQTSQVSFVVLRFRCGKR
jgi:hypothetical protein